MSSANNGRDAPPAGETGSVVLLVAGGRLACIVINHLARLYPNLVVLQEEGESKWRILKRRVRLLGWAPALGQVAAGVVLKVVGKLSKGRIEEICSAHGLDWEMNSRVRPIPVGSVNSEKCRKTLRALSPAVVAVYGTRIISRRTLQCVSAPFINYHAGINPKYRGQQPGYWALVSRDAENAGVTIHLVDEGVDTGEVLYQARVDFCSRDNITTYQYVQMTRALPLFCRAIDDALAGNLRPVSVALPSRQWFPPTVWSYLWNGVAKGVW